MHSRLSHSPSLSLSTNRITGARTRPELPADDELASRLDTLLDKLDLAAESEAQKVKRRSARARFRHLDITVRIHHPGGSMTHRRVATRNLSAGGIGFLLDGFVHDGTHCQVDLPRIDGEQETVSARVVSCCHVSGPHHLVGLQFAQPLDPRHFVEVEQLAALTEDLSPMRGRLLLLDDVEAEHSLFMFHLRQTEIEVVCCSTLSHALQCLSEQSFDLVVTELGLAAAVGAPAQASPVERSVDVLKQIRQSGYTGRLAVCTAESDNRILRAAHEHDLLGVLRKPYTPQEQLGVIEQWLRQSSRSGLVTRSSLSDKLELRPMLEQFVGFANAASKELGEAIRREQIQECRMICLKLYGTAGNLGYGILSDVAASAATSLEKTNNIPQSLGQLQRLQAMCSRVAA